MKIKLTASKFNEYQGKVVEAAYVDDNGDVNLGKDAYEIYGYRWAFAGEYVVVSEEEAPAKYTVTLEIKDLLELHDLLQTLPRSLVEAATLTTN